MMFSGAVFVREFLGGDMHADTVSDYIEDLALALWYFGSDMKHDYPVTWNKSNNELFLFAHAFKVAKV